MTSRFFTILFVLALFSCAQPSSNPTIDKDLSVKDSAVVKKPSTSDESAISEINALDTIYFLGTPEMNAVLPFREAVKVIFMGDSSIWLSASYENEFGSGKIQSTLKRSQMFIGDHPILDKANPSYVYRGKTGEDDCILYLTPDTAFASILTISTSLSNQPPLGILLKRRIEPFHLPRLFKVEYNSIDTAVSMEDWEEYSFEMEFNYPQFPIKDIADSCLILLDSNYTFNICSESFDSSAEGLFYEEEENGIVYLHNVRGKPVLGTDGFMPRVQIKSIQLEGENFLLEFPKAQFEDLFEPNFYGTYIYRTPDNTLLVLMNNSDGAASYSVLWHIDEGKIINRHISYGP